MFLLLLCCGLSTFYSIDKYVCNEYHANVCSWLRKATRTPTRVHTDIHKIYNQLLLTASPMSFILLKNHENNFNHIFLSNSANRQAS